MTPEQIIDALKASSLKDFKAILLAISDIAETKCRECRYFDCHSCFAFNSDNCPCDVDYGLYAICPCEDCVMQIFKGGVNFVGSRFVQLHDIEIEQAGYVAVDSIVAITVCVDRKHRVIGSCVFTYNGKFCVRELPCEVHGLIASIISN